MIVEKKTWLSAAQILCAFSVLFAGLGIRGASAAALRQIDQLALQETVDKAIKELMVPGAMVLLRTPQKEFIVGSGTTKIGTTVLPQVGTYFRIASNTKTMTAAAILLLVQEEKIGLGDPVSKYVTGVRNGDAITIAQLLSMRSGLYNYTMAPELAASLDHDPTKTWNPDELLAIANKHQPGFAPGEKFEYCNTNYLLLGLIAEKAEAKPLAVIFKERLFTPLDMKQTLLPAAPVNTMPEPYSHGYLYGSSSYALADEPYPAEMQAKIKAGILKPNDDTDQNPSYARAAGGAISTAHDQAVWIRALVRGRVLNAEMQRKWLASPAPEGPAKPHGQKYGYGITKISFGPNSIYFHGGELPGFNSFIGHDPANDVTLIVWTNLTLSAEGRVTANAVMLKVLDQIYVESPLKK
jgi:D-alanyl-D-alanine carboxypeptidase